MVWGALQWPICNNRENYSATLGKPKLQIPVDSLCNKETNKEDDGDRTFVICEQLDEHFEIMKKRMAALFSTDEYEDCSFISCELTEYNSRYLEQIDSIDDHDVLDKLFDLCQNKGCFIPHFDPTIYQVSAHPYEELTLENKKAIFSQLLDKNKLYVNLCDMDDGEMQVREQDKAFTRSFYRLSVDGGR